METKNLWNSFLCKIKEELSPIAYETWFSETKLFKLEDNTAKIIVPILTRNSLDDFCDR